MATRHLIQGQIYLKLGILFVLYVATTGLHAHNITLSHSKAGESSLIADPESGGPNTICCIPCSEKFLINSYFKRHDVLLDLEPCPSDSCKGPSPNISSIVRISGLQRHLSGEGSHRRLLSTVNFDIQSDATVEPSLDSCEAVIVERLPAGVFVDPFELQHLVQRGVFVDAAVLGDTNLELPSVHSRQSIVETHIDIDHSNRALEINSGLPLHARYPPLGESGYSTVEIGTPDLLIRCNGEYLEDGRCSWLLFGWDSNVVAKTVGWQIPCGNKAHAGVVSAVTAVSALVSSLIIVLASIYSSSQTDETKDPK